MLASKYLLELVEDKIGRKDFAIQSSKAVIQEYIPMIPKFEQAIMITNIEHC